MQAKKAIVVLSGKGGVGKTSVTVDMARELDAGILDVDVHDPNVPEEMDGETERKMYATDSGIYPAVIDGVEVMSLSFDLPEDTVMMRHGEQVHDKIKQWVELVKWESDTVIIDSPPGCLTTGTRVWTENGSKEIQDVKEGEKVFTFDGELRNKPIRIEEEGEYREVEKLVDSGEQEVYELTTNTRKIEATADHPVLCATKEDVGTYSLQWKEISEIEPGEFVLLYKKIKGGSKRKLPSTGENINENKEKNITIPEHTSIQLCRLIGYYIGDGFISEHSTHFIDGNKENIKLYKNIIMDLFDYEPTITEKQNSSAQRLNIYRKRVGESFKKLGLEGDAHSKRIPEWVYSEPIEHRNALLQGLIDSDGHRRTKDYSDGTRRKGNMSVELCNKELVEDIRQLAISTGKRANNIRNRTRKNYWREKRGTGQEESECWSFGMPIKKDKDDPTPSKGTPKYKGAPFIRSLGKDGLPGLSDDVWGFDGVRSIEKTGKKRTWNLVVEGNHNFTADGIVVHNTGSATTTVLARVPDAECIVVTTGAKTSIQDCRRTIKMLHNHDMNLVGIIDNMTEYSKPKWLHDLIEEDDGVDIPDDTLLKMPWYKDVDELEEAFRFKRQFQYSPEILGQVPVYLDKDKRREKIGEIIENIKEVK